MEPVPTSFHVGPLVFHTYGFGLAIAAYVAYLYARHRLVKAGISVTPFGKFTAVIIVAGLVGARLAHVATNWSYYQSNPSQVFSLWHGGLASFGGIALALPFGLWAKKHWWPDVRLLAFTDALVPALVAGWALGRVLGPQFMVNGGGHATHQWFGLRYAGQVGKRVPVPLIQALEDGALWLVLLRMERSTRVEQAPGTVTGVALVVWGLVRALDEHLLLGQESGSGSVGVQIAGLAMALGGLVILVSVARKLQKAELIH